MVPSNVQEVVEDELGAGGVLVLVPWPEVTFHSPATLALRVRKEIAGSFSPFLHAGASRASSNVPDNNLVVIFICT